MRWNNDETQVSQNTNVKLHKVVLLDCSGSMHGAKYDVAELGVKQDYEACKGEFADYLLVEFSIDKREQLHDFTKPLQFRPYFSGTALYKTIHEVFTSLLTNIPKEDKVLVQIFTDGQDENSANYRAKAKRVIDKFNSIGWTVTFVGTEHDVAFVQANLSIDATNTLVHDNTASGVATSFETYRGATSSYTKAVKRGEQVTKGFFKSIK